MKIQLMQQILLIGKPRTYRPVYKEFESSIIPCKGDFVSDSAFKDPYEHEVVQVSINYQRDECLVTLHMLEIDSDNEDDVKKYMEVYKLHGWTYMDF